MAAAVTRAGRRATNARAAAATNAARPTSTIRASIATILNTVDPHADPTATRYTCAKATAT